MKRLALAIIGCAFLHLVAHSCATRRKEVHAAASEYKFNADIDSSFSFRESLNNQQTITSGFNSRFLNLAVSYDGKPGDSLSIEQFGSDGKLQGKTVFRGSGKVQLESGTKTETLEQQTTTTGTSEKNGSGTIAKKVSGEASNESLDKAVSRNLLSSFWFWLILVLLAGAWYLQKRYSWATKLFKR